MPLSPLDRLPVAVRTYLGAHAGHDVPAAAACFAPGAVVVDDGASYRGRAEIGGWLTRSAAEYTYTTTPTAVARHDDGIWHVTQRLEGNFPGGVAVLGFAFRVREGHITSLDIRSV
ncbi:nuclear transport factor 2 family protein [Streptomyces sp. AHA2]|uniref:nuclear transport factor 2 family protein n=1 Tax=Streptomyces sp. AHA2 TaxID=3064526 RepID=UPI002FE014A6